MKCPKCEKILDAIEYKNEIIDRFRIDSIFPETIVLLPKAVYYCNECQVRIEETLPIKTYK